MSYQFLDANSSILSAQSSLMGGLHYPIVIASIVGSFNITGSVMALQASNVSSIVGTVGVSSVTGAITLYAQPGSYTSGVSSVVTSATAASVLAAPGANLRNYITAIKVTNAAANAVIVDIKDSGANVLDSGYAAASGGGWSSSFPTPLRQLTTNASIDVVPRSQGSVIAAISGFISS